jgi:GT2 family glycosyltransferase
MEVKTISIIICTRNNAESLRATLQAIGRCIVPENTRVELWVIDNGSIDHTPEVVRTTPMDNMLVRYASEPKPGKGNAYNKGLAQACGDTLLFTDDDVRVPVHWIAAMAAALEDKGFDAVAGGVRIAKHLERPWLTPGLRAALAETSCLDPDDVYTLVGANMGIRRGVLEKVPAFDPELGPGALGFFEESLFTWQLKRAGYKVGSAFDVVAEHWCGASRLHRKAFLGTAEKHGRCRGYLHYHYHHGASIRFALVRLARAHLRLHLLRALHPGNWNRRDGAADWEISAVWEIGFLSQCQLEQRRSRAYEREGLRRL